MRIIESFPHEVREIENVWIPLPDGSRLAARLWLPGDAETQPVPAILEYIPYRKRDFMVCATSPSITTSPDTVTRRYVWTYAARAIRTGCWWTSTRLRSSTTRWPCCSG